MLFRTRVGAVVASVTIAVAGTHATAYYVDFANGLDSNDGRSTGAPWRTLARVNAAALNPGDSVCFKRGTTGTGQLTVSRSGTAQSPITFTAYGTGTAPVIRNPGAQWQSAIRIESDYTIVENLLAREAFEAGVNITAGSEHTVVRDNEIAQCGTGVMVSGRYSLVTRNHAHDLVMIVNTQGGDDDYGAVGVWLYGSGNEISYNRLINCTAPSYDYGADGGMVEFYGDVDSCIVHHNWGENCNGTFEAGGQGETLSGNRVAYNVAVNSSVAGGFHVGSTFGVQFRDFRVENNTFVEPDETGEAIGFWGGTPNTSDFVYRNNIFCFPSAARICSQSSFTHQNNLYYLGGRTTVGFAMGTGDRLADPQFVDLSAQNFRLRAGSSAINNGAALGYTVDFAGTAVPQETVPDIGAYEFVPVSRIYQHVSTCQPLTVPHERALLTHATVLLNGRVPQASASSGLSPRWTPLRILQANRQ